MIRILMALAAAAAWGGELFASDPVPRGARSGALGGLSAPLPQEVWSAAVNPALACTVPGICAAAEYVPAPFGLPELARAGAAVNIRAGESALRASFTVMGSALYRELTLEAGAAVSVTARGSLGVTCRMVSIRIRDYGQASSTAVDVGAGFFPAEGIHVGAAVTNLAASRWPGGNLERAVQCGVWLELADNLSAGIECWKTRRFPVEIHAGIEYLPVTGFALRGGISQDPPGISIGAGAAAGPFAFDYAAVFHPVLGTTHVLGLCFTGD